jgi:hypothetical protein
MTNALVPMVDIQKMAAVAANSRMFGFKNPDEAMAIMLLCQAENMHPAIAMRDYHIINSRPALKSDAMLARFQAQGGKVDWTSYTDEEVTGVFSHPAGGKVAVTWTWAMAERLQFTKKENWRNYPRAMMRARCISEGIRTVFPGCVAGVYTPEEVQDMEPPREVVATIVEPIVEPEEDPPFKVFLPDGTPYSGHNDLDAARMAYMALIDKIQRNAKMKQEDKDAKCLQLKNANTHLHQQEESDDV